jgi:prevent-host-death family protein
MVFDVKLDEAKERLPDLIDAVVRGEEVLISKDGEQVRLVPVVRTRHRRRALTASGLLPMSCLECSTSILLACRLEGGAMFSPIYL